MRIKLIVLILLIQGCTKTVTRTDRIVDTVRDTLTVTNHDTVSVYPEPNDTGIIFLAYDTVPGFKLDSICVQDINTDHVYTYLPEFHINGYIIRPPIPMLTAITFYYEWEEPNNVTISMSTFDYTKGWIMYPKNYSPHSGVHFSNNTFTFIDISRVFTITFVNH
jgi:hypothetical protein